VRAERRILVTDYLTDADLRDAGLDPDDVPRLFPWATPLTGHAGTRCWDAADLTTAAAEGDA
jgi:hypothetical protein